MKPAYWLLKKSVKTSKAIRSWRQMMIIYENLLDFLLNLSGKTFTSGTYCHMSSHMTITSWGLLICSHVRLLGQHVSLKIGTEWPINLTMTRPCSYRPAFCASNNRDDQRAWRDGEKLQYRNRRRHHVCSAGMSAMSKPSVSCISLLS